MYNTLFERKQPHAGDINYVQKNALVLTILHGCQKKKAK